MVMNSSRVGKSVSLRRSCHTYGIPRNSSTATPLLAEISVQGHSCLGRALENVELFDCPVGFSFA